MVSVIILVLLVVALAAALIARLHYSRSLARLEADDSAFRQEVRDARTFRNISTSVAAVLLVAMTITLLSGIVYTQDPGEAIVLRSVSGEVTGVDTTSGFGVKAPWTSTVSFDIRNQRIEMFTNDSGIGPDGAQVDLGLKGGASANTSVVVRYSIRPEAVRGIYNEFKSEGNLLERELRPGTRDAVRDAAAQYEAFTVKENRSKLANDVEAILSDRWDTYGIVVEGVDLGNISLDADTEEAISGVNVSRQRVETSRNELDAARIAAETTKVEAQAQADADQIIRCGAVTEQVTEVVAGQEVTSTKVVPLTGAECEERLNQQVLTSKYLDALKELGATGNMIVVIPNDPAGGANGPIINLPTPEQGG